MGGYGGYQVMGYKNLEQLKGQFEEVSLRRLKKDVLDLPDKIYTNEYVEMTPKQEKIYKEDFLDIINLIQYKGQLIIFVSAPTISKQKEIEINTLSIEERLSNFDLLNEINMRGTTVVVATHAKEIVDQMKKRVIHINKGKIVRDDKKGGYNCEV